MTITKATTHVTQNEALVFERSQTGRRGYRLPALDVEETSLDELLPAELRRDDDLEGVPELSEPDVVRHFTRISTWNYNIDLGLYPLGSCTMKYNSRLNERVARIPGFASLHPLAPEEDAQGASGWRSARPRRRATRSLRRELYFIVHEPSGYMPRSML